MTGGHMGGTLYRPDREGPHRGQFEANRKIILATQTLCGICGKPVDKTLRSPDPMSATVDHIIPVSRHGHPSALDNLQLAHRVCNRLKADRLNFEVGREGTPSELPKTRDWRHA